MLSSVMMNIWWRNSRNQVTTAGTMPCHILPPFSHTTFLTTSEQRVSLAFVFPHPSQQYTINMLPHSTQRVIITWILNPLCYPNTNLYLQKKDSHQPLLCVTIKMENSINFTNELCWKYIIKKHMYSTTTWPFPLHFSSNTRLYLFLWHNKTFRREAGNSAEMGAFHL